MRKEKKTFIIEFRLILPIPNRKVSDLVASLIVQVEKPKRKYHMNNIYENIYRIGTGKLRFAGGKVIEVDMPDQDQQHRRFIF